jgi:hypothetical protein
MCTKLNTLPGSLASFGTLTETHFSARYCLRVPFRLIRAALKEAVMYHALANHKKDDCQNDYKY